LWVFLFFDFHVQAFRYTVSLMGPGSARRTGLWATSSFPYSFCAPLRLSKVSVTSLVSFLSNLTPPLNLLPISFPLSTYLSSRKPHPPPLLPSKAKLSFFLVFNFRFVPFFSVNDTGEMIRRRFLFWLKMSFLFPSFSGRLYLLAIVFLQKLFFFHLVFSSFPWIPRFIRGLHIHLWPILTF